MKKRNSKFLAEKGASLCEYCVLLATIAIIAVTALQIMGTKVSSPILASACAMGGGSMSSMCDDAGSINPTGGPAVGTGPN